MVLNGTFTQDDIDTNRITYEHDGSETTVDAFNFSLADGGGKRGDRGDGNLQSDDYASERCAGDFDQRRSDAQPGRQRNDRHGATQRKRSDDSGADLTYTVTALPSNGSVKKNGTALNLNETFTQADIDANNITYEHDGSSTTSDAFNFSLADGGEDGATAATEPSPSPSTT